jgi:CRP-like cAMP-binding protein
MLTIEDYKDLTILSDLSDPILERIVPITDVLRYDEGDRIFQEGEKADRFYFLKRGKILLEKRISDKITFSIGAIKPGYSFGWSAMLEGQLAYTTDTVCSEPSEVYSILGVRLRKILEEDAVAGFAFTKQLLWVVKDRLDHRTRQMVQVLKNHPQIGTLI